MKKKSYLLFLCLFCSVCLWGQNELSEKLAGSADNLGKEPLYPFLHHIPDSIIITQGKDTLLQGISGNIIFYPAYSQNGGNNKTKIATINGKVYFFDYQPDPNELRVIEPDEESFKIKPREESLKLKATLYYLIRNQLSDSVKIIPATDVLIYTSNKEKSKKFFKTNSSGLFKETFSKDELEDTLVFSGTDKSKTSVLIKNIGIDECDIYMFKEIKKVKFDTCNFKIRVRGAKPAIYLYPTTEQQIKVNLDFKGKLGTTYPKLNSGWTVTAKPNGEITNLADARKFNYLFWEGTYDFPLSHSNYPSGFIVSKKELEKFLIEKLSYIGLNNNELNDFIVYWLPRLEKNEYNLIYFFINDNIDNCAFLNVTPKPDTEIRLFMEFKAVDKNYQIPTQILPHIQRKGFTLVEWGGGMYDNNKVE